MIICAYPGIGTTTLCNTNLKYVELPEQMITDRLGFYIGSTYTGWIAPYVSVAYGLHLQGYTVFISAQIDVITEAITRFQGICFPNDLVIIHPAKELQAEWADRLYKKYASLPPDPCGDGYPDGERMIAYSNWRRTTNREFLIDIRNYQNLQVRRVELTDMKYDLASVVENLNR